MYEKFLEIAKKESPALRDLIETQEAYVFMLKDMRKFDTKEEETQKVKVMDVCRKSIMRQALAIAIKDGTNKQLIKVLRYQDPTSLNWSEIIFILADQTLAVGTYYDKVMESLSR